RYSHALSAHHSSLPDGSGSARAEIVEAVGRAGCGRTDPCPTGRKDGFDYSPRRGCGTIHVSPQLPDVLDRYWGESQVAAMWLGVPLSPSQQLGFDLSRFDRTRPRASGVRALCAILAVSS